MTFTAIGEVIKFDGFLRDVYRESYDDENEQEDESRLLPPLKKGQKLEYGPIVATERFTNARHAIRKPAWYANWKSWASVVHLHMHLPFLLCSNANMWKKGNKERTFNVLTLKDNQIKDESHNEVTGAEKVETLSYRYRNCGE